MKITGKNYQAFSPVTLSIIFETKEELDKFGTLFNISAVAEAMPEDMAKTLYEAVVKHGGSVGNVSSLMDKIIHHSSVIFRLRK